MVSIREYFIIASGYRKPAAYFCIGEGTAKRNQPTGDPCCKKQECIWRGFGHIQRGAEDTHPNHQAHHDHGEIEEVKLFGFASHALKIIFFIVPQTIFYLDDLTTCLYICTGFGFRCQIGIKRESR